MKRFFTLIRGGGSIKSRSETAMKFRRRVHSIYFRTFFFLVFFLLAGLLVMQCTRPVKEAEPEKNEFVGDASCKSCHTKEHSEWLTSDHFKAMEIATDSTVLEISMIKSFVPRSDQAGS